MGIILERYHCGACRDKLWASFLRDITVVLTFKCPCCLFIFTYFVSQTLLTLTVNLLWFFCMLSTSGDIVYKGKERILVTHLFHFILFFLLRKLQKCNSPYWSMLSTVKNTVFMNYWNFLQNCITHVKILNINKILHAEILSKGYLPIQFLWRLNIQSWTVQIWHM
jgi:hypothetical protein